MGFSGLRLLGIMWLPISTQSEQTDGKIYLHLVMEVREVHINDLTDLGITVFKCVVVDEQGFSSDSQIEAALHNGLQCRKQSIAGLLAVILKQLS